MDVLVQGERVKRLHSLRLIARRLKERARAQEQTTGTPSIPKPGWLLLFFDVCCVAGLLVLTLYISWVYDRLPAGDPREYHIYAMTFWQETPLFHAFPKEYPPLSLIPFSFTLFPASSNHFYWSFAEWMGLIVCVSYVWFARYLSRPKALIYVLYLLVGATSTLLMRFDLLPALVTLVALVLAEHKRYRWAYALLAIGVLLKLYPVFLVPVVMAHQWRETALARPGQAGPGQWDPRQWLAALRQGFTASKAAYGAALFKLWQRSKEILAGLGIFLAVTLLGFSIPAIINFNGTLSEFRYALTRPIQIESVPASLLWLGTLLGFPAQPNNSYNSLNLVGPLDSTIKTFSLLALIGGMLLVCWWVGRGKLSLRQAFVALIAVVLASNKLLSPQYIMWILPLVAYAEGFDLTWLTICALTTLIFPFIYQTRHPLLMVPTNPAFLPTIAVRNALLVAATVQALRGGRRAAAPNEAEAVELDLADLTSPELLPQPSPAALGNQGASEEGSPPLVQTK